LSNQVTLYGLKMPIIEEKADLVSLIVDSARSANVGLEDRDVLALTTKIVSKALGLLVALSEVKPSKRALGLSKKTGVDARFLEVLLRESDDTIAAVPIKKMVEKGLVDFKGVSRSPEKVLRALDIYPTLFITSREGTLWSNSGLDSSNHPPGVVSMPPRNADKIAKSISLEIKRRVGKSVAVVLCDTEIFLEGSLDLARGSYGIRPVTPNFGEEDLYGKPKFGGVDHLAHEVCCAAALLMRQTGEGIPAVLVRGLEYEWCDCGLRDYKVTSVAMLKGIVWEVFKHTLRVLGVRHALRLLLA